MSIPLTERQQRAVEYFLDNESLTSDLTDELARPLIEWATTHAAQAAADEQYTDEDLDSLLVALRRAVRHVASDPMDDDTPEQLWARADDALANQGIQLISSSHAPTSEPEQLADDDDTENESLADDENETQGAAI